MRLRWLFTDQPFLPVGTQSVINNRVWNEDQVSDLAVGQLQPVIANYQQDARWELPPNFPRNHLCHSEWFGSGEPFPNDLPDQEYTSYRGTLFPICCGYFNEPTAGGVMIGGSVLPPPTYPRGGVMIGGRSGDTFTPMIPPPPPDQPYPLCQDSATTCALALPSQVGPICPIRGRIPDMWRVWPIEDGLFYTVNLTAYSPETSVPTDPFAEVHVFCGDACADWTEVDVEFSVATPWTFLAQFNCPFIFLWIRNFDPKVAFVNAFIEPAPGDDCESAMPVQLDTYYSSTFQADGPDRWFVYRNLPAGDYCLEVVTYETVDDTVTVSEGSCAGLVPITTQTAAAPGFCFTHTTDSDLFLKWSPGTSFIAFAFRLTAAP